MFENLLLERDGTAAVVTLSRQQVLDALDLATIRDPGRAVGATALRADVRAPARRGRE